MGNQTKDFYDKQDSLTEVKINFYKKYIEVYLIKILMFYKECIIADLFCGQGKNGSEKGSPLILIDEAQYILTAPQLVTKNPRINILFNDKETTNIQNLELELKKIQPRPEINIFPPQSQEFENILPKLIKAFTNIETPKFFFLDPFTYSTITMDQLKQLMSLRNAEVLLFLPFFHCYRFANCPDKMKPDHKTRIFLENFTTKGIADYSDPDNFLKSIRQKLMIDLDLDFVRPILIDGGSRKNCLIFMSKSQKGMLEMNKLARRESEDGRGYVKKAHLQQTLFGTTGTDAFTELEVLIEKILKEHKEISNRQFLYLIIKEGFLPKDGKALLSKWVKEGTVKIVTPFDEDLTTNSNKWKIAEKVTEETIIKYTG